MDTTVEEEMRASDFRFYARIGYLAIVIVFGGFGVWASYAPLDSAAVAQGKVALETDRKPVQHLEGGIIDAILVKETERVVEGQVLFRLRPTQAKTNSEVLQKQLDAGIATEARLVAEQSQAPAITFPAEVLARASNPETAQTLADQQQSFIERRRSIENQVELQKAKIDQATRDNVGKEARLKISQSQYDSYALEIGRVTILADKGFYPQNKLLGSKREQSRIEAEITATKTEIALNLARIDEARLQIRQIYQQRQEQNAENLAKQRGQNSDYREKLAVANDVLNRVDVRAPRAGVVQAIKFHALGAVVKPGDTLAEVIPISDNLVLSAKITPTDINNVAVGQTAEVRFPAFAYKHLPAIFGQVRSVSADSLVDDESPTKQHYYKAKVIIDQKTIPAEIAGSLVPGMPADVVIITGERTLLQYLLGPVIQRLTVGMREK